MNIEQPELGSIGVDAASITLGWSLERGWSGLVSSRLSGASSFRTTRYAGHDAAELHAVLSDHLAELLGLI